MPFFYFKKIDLSKLIKYSVAYGNFGELLSIMSKCHRDSGGSVYQELKIFKWSMPSQDPITSVAG
ncbi:hypothetical protein EFK68_13105 [Pseudomonas aeruginosa]|nr:hypothetical protein BMR72_15825 [Pseudomonas aeruginosa]OFQ82103.1 hypothetical protein HMPREF2924_07965 [Pseudomonas sp. HMSC063H08]ARI92071.1 hypothetical protein B7W86_18060 [Pseudomonas aeruginosa]ARI98508.1 hypothetical protein B7W87_18065 [Pseudomonas aeruginosa]ASA16276.1 hypothetical protein CDL16_19670 [Pseudomonas aeruginosa]